MKRFPVFSVFCALLIMLPVKVNAQMSREQFAKIAMTLMFLDEYYIDSLDYDKLADKAIEAMLKEYTDHIVPEKDIAETLYELENEDKAKIFPENGFSFGEGESNTLELTLGDLKDHKLARSSKLPGYIKSTGSLSLIQYRKAINNVLLKGHKGAFEDMAYLPLRWFDTEISSCSVSGDKANGLFLIRRNPSGALIPALLFAYGPDFQKDLLYMINYSLRRALDVCPPDTPLLIRMKNKSTRALAHKLLPEHVGKKVFVGNRIEK